MQSEPGPHRSQATVKPADATGFHTKTLPFILLVLITLIAYANAWPDNLTLDDKVFAASERYSGMSLFDIPRFFAEDLWAASGGNSGLYRPLLLVTIATDAFAYGDWAAGYHLSNILLHLMVTILLYGFVRHLLFVSGGQSPLSGHIALLAAMVFAVHPIHTEVVNSIFNRSSLLVSAGVIGGLWWFLGTVQSRPLKAWTGLALVYFVVLFCKETAVILPALAVVVLWLFTPGNWRDHFRQSVPVLWLLIPLGVYLALRAHALDAPGLPEVADLTAAANAPGPSESTGVPETGQIPLVVDSSLHFEWTRLIDASRIWFESLRLFVWPHPLQINHSGFLVNTWIALVTQMALIGMAIAGFVKKRYGLIAGLAFFYLAMLPASQIIGASGAVTYLSERFLYLPSTGAAIALAFGLTWLAQRFRFRVAMTSVLIASLILTPITWARNAEWASDVLLYESDYRHGNRQGRLLHFLVGAHVREQNYVRAVTLCDRHVTQLTTNTKLSDSCGLAYGQLGRFDEAEQALLFALSNPSERASTHQKLASMYLHLGRRSDAQKHFELSVQTEPHPALREFRKANLVMKLYPSDRARLLEAKTHLEQALRLQPQLNQARQSLQQLEQILGNG